MKVRYVGANNLLELLNGKIYDAISVEGGCYRIRDETGEDYLCSQKDFEIVKPKQMVLCHDCGKRLPGSGITVTADNSKQRQVCEYCARFYKD
jgi:hypothetical protein